MSNPQQFSVMGVFETLKAASKLTMPVVRKKVFPRVSPEEQSDVLAPIRPPGQAPSPNEPVRFGQGDKTHPVRLTKIKSDSAADLEQQIESISQEFVNSTES